LAFDPERRLFDWDPGAIRQRRVTANVAELLVRRLASLGPESRRTIHLAACLGNQFDSRSLAWIRDTSDEAIWEELQPALDAGLVIATSRQATEHADATAQQRRLRFLHDRVQQAAYGVDEGESRERTRLRIGRCLLSHASDAERQERLFEILDHLNA